MAKRLQFSRWRRLQGAYRFGDKKPPDPNAERVRISLYLPAGLLDQAEALSLRAGAPDLQHYCEDLLTHAIEAEHAREQFEEMEARRGPLEGLDAIANDPEYLAELTSTHGPRDRLPPPTIRSAPVREIDVTRPEPPLMLPPSSPDFDPGPGPGFAPEPSPRHADSPAAPAPRPGPSRAARAVLRHAGLEGDDPAGLLACLRRGEPIGAAAGELLPALVELEAELAGAASLDRRLAYALHKLAFEGQILVTDAWPGAAGDAATVGALQLVQEGVDRVLSGEDIRYYSRGS